MEETGAMIKTVNQFQVLVVAIANSGARETLHFHNVFIAPVLFW